jgi:hypothetical protein
MAANLVFRLSGGASNTDVNASIGGVMSSTVASNYWDVVTAAEALAGDIEYRLLYVTNTGDQPASLTRAFVSTQAAPADITIAIGLATEGLNTTVTAVADENTAPAGVSFSSPTTLGAGLSIGTLAAGDRFGVWVRRTVDASAAGQNSVATEVAAGYEFVPD